MSSMPIPRYTPEQYVEIERNAESRSEYVNGLILPRGSAAPAVVSVKDANSRHEQIVDNIVMALRQRLSSPTASIIYRAVLDYVTPKGATTDVAVRWDETIVPAVIIEVLSPTTEGDDRGQKFAHYRRLNRLNEYVMVSQERPIVEHYTRQDENQWTLRENTGLTAALHLPSLDLELPLSKIYARVEFPPWSGWPENEPLRNICQNQLQFLCP